MVKKHTLRGLPELKIMEEAFRRELKKIPDRHPFPQVLLDDIPSEKMTPKFWRGVEKEIDELRKRAKREHNISDDDNEGE